MSRQMQDLRFIPAALPGEAARTDLTFRCPVCLKWTEPDDDDGESSEIDEDGHEHLICGACHRHELSLSRPDAGTIGHGGTT